MKIVIDLQRESVSELSKCIDILKKVIENKNNNKPVTEGLDQFNAPRQPDLTSTPARKMLEQEKYMNKIDLGELLSKN